MIGEVRSKLKRNRAKYKEFIANLIGTMFAGITAAFLVSEINFDKSIIYNIWIILGFIFFIGVTYFFGRAIINLLHPKRDLYIYKISYIVGILGSIFVGSLVRFRDYDNISLLAFVIPAITILAAYFSLKIKR